MTKIGSNLIEIKDKKTRKDNKQGKATLISLLGYRNAIKYSQELKSKILINLKKYKKKTEEIEETLNYILTRNK